MHAHYWDISYYSNGTCPSVCLPQSHQNILPSLWTMRWHQGIRWLLPALCYIPVHQNCLLSPGATMAVSRVHRSRKVTVNGRLHLTTLPSLLLEKTTINISAVLQSLKGRKWQATKRSKLNVSLLYVSLGEINDQALIQMFVCLFLFAVNSSAVRLINHI